MSLFLSTVGVFGSNDPDQVRDNTYAVKGQLGRFYAFPADSKSQSVSAGLCTKIFQFVKIVDVTSAVSGCPLYWYSTYAAGEGSFCVTTDPTNVGRPAGVLVNATTMPAANDYILMQVRGVCDIYIKAGPTTPALVTGATAAIANTIGQVDIIATGVTPALPAFGYTVEASAGTELAQIMLTVPLVF